MSEQLKYKMYNYEVVPPGDIWNSIHNELEDQERPGSLSRRMLPFEVIPPVGVWQDIAAELEQTPVRNINSWNAKLRWIAAAIFIIFLMSGSYYFFNSENSKNSTTASAVSTINSEQSNKVPTLASNLPSENKSIADISTDYDNDQITKSATIRKTQRKLHSSQVTNANIIDDEQVIIHARQIMNESGEPIQDMSVINPSNDKYISITAPNGKQTKISSKLATAMPYVGYFRNDGEDISENDWKERIEDWKIRIMQSGFVPTSGNFLDILQLAELIKE